MNRQDKKYIAKLQSMIVDRKNDQLLVARAYARLKETRGKTNADFLMTAIGAFKGRRKIDPDEVKQQLGLVFQQSSASVPKSASKARTAWIVLPSAVAFLILLMVLHQFGIEPQGLSLILLSMLLGLVCALLVWLDDGAAEITGKMFRTTDMKGKYRMAGSAAAFVIGTLAALSIIIVGLRLLPNGPSVPDDSAPIQEAERGD